MKFTKLFLAAAILGTVLCLSACAGGAGAPESDKTMTTQISNPFVDCDTVEAAAEVAGFSMAVPESVDGYEGQYIQAIEGKLLQVAYGNAENELLMRKALGSEDISGDYNSYGQTATIQVNGNAVTMKGNDGGVQVAIWTAGEYTYAVDVTGTPLSTEAMTAVVEKIS